MNLNSIPTVCLMAQTSNDKLSEVQALVTTIGLTIGIMLLIGAILYAVPYIAGAKKINRNKNNKK